MEVSNYRCDFIDIFLNLNKSKDMILDIKKIILGYMYGSYSDCYFSHFSEIDRILNINVFFECGQCELLVLSCTECTISCEIDSCRNYLCGKCKKNKTKCYFCYTVSILCDNCKYQYLCQICGNYVCFRCIDECVVCMCNICQDCTSDMCNMTDCLCSDCADSCISSQ